MAMSVRNAGYLMGTSSNCHVQGHKANQQTILVYVIIDIVLVILVR